MDKYEKLLYRAVNDGISIDEDYPFKGKTYGLYIDGNIALSNKLKTTKEKTCVLAEELGHYYTTAGDIIDLNDTNNRKQELRARAWGYNQLIGMAGLVQAFEHGCRNRYEMAEYLDITEEYLEEALKHYRSKYGVYTTFDQYVIYFEPYFSMAKIFS